MDILGIPCTPGDQTNTIQITINSLSLSYHIAHEFTTRQGFSPLTETSVHKKNKKYGLPGPLLLFFNIYTRSNLDRYFYLTFLSLVRSMEMSVYAKIRARGVYFRRRRLTL
jgi:hypothetical protein